MNYILLIFIFSCFLIHCSIQNVEQATAGNVTGTVFDKGTNQPLSNCEILAELTLVDRGDTFYIRTRSDTFPPTPQTDTVLTDMNGYYEYSWGWIGGGGGIMIIDLRTKKINYEELDTMVTVSINALKTDNNAIINLYLSQTPKQVY